MRAGIDISRNSGARIDIARGSIIDKQAMRAPRDNRSPRMHCRTRNA